MRFRKRSVTLIKFRHNINAFRFRKTIGDAWFQMGREYLSPGLSLLCVTIHSNPNLCFSQHLLALENHVTRRNLFKSSRSDDNGFKIQFHDVKGYFSVWMHR